MNALNWLADGAFELGGTVFQTAMTPDQYHSIKSEPGRFLLVKNDRMIEKEMALLARQPVRTMLDIGIFQGGSVALFDRMLKPDKLVALEVQPTPIEALNHYIETHDRGEAVRVHYGIDQSDRDKVASIIQDEFGNRKIDLVIDDASHQYEQTKSCFETVFPFVAEGGFYVIEDWSWSFTGTWARPYFEGKPALANLIVQCIALTANRPDLMQSVELSQHIAIIQKGSGQAVLGEFSVDRLATNRGKPIAAYL